MSIPRPACRDLNMRTKQQASTRPCGVHFAAIDLTTQTRNAISDGPPHPLPAASLPPLLPSLPSKVAATMGGFVVSEIGVQYNKNRAKSSANALPQSRERGESNFNAHPLINFAARSQRFTLLTGGLTKRTRIHKSTNTAAQVCRRVCDVGAARCSHNCSYMLGQKLPTPSSAQRIVPKQNAACITAIRGRHSAFVT